MFSVAGANHYRQVLGTTIFILSINGYPLVALISTILNLDSQALSIPFRAIVSSLVFLGLVTKARFARPTINQLCFWLFIIIYLFRLLWDFIAGDVPQVQQALSVYLFIVVLPSFAAGQLLGGRLPEWACSWYLGLLGGIICLLASAMRTLGWGAEQTIDPIATVGRLVFIALNPITLGHVAVTTLICLLCLISYRPNYPTRILCVAIAIISLYCLFLTGSRGPLVALAVCSIVYSYNSKNMRLAVLLSVPLLVGLAGPEVLFLSRFASMDVDPSSLQRLQIQYNALQQFFEHPVLGSAYIDVVTGEYPHNLFIDAAMSMGIIGLFSLALLLYRASLVAWNQLKHGQTLIPLLCVQFLVASQFSGSIWGSAQLFIVLSVLLSSRQLNYQYL